MPMTFNERIVELEYSEWNDIFLYVVSVLKEETSEFKYPAARIQVHLTEIHSFLETVEDCQEAVTKLTALPPVWVENILIVDDDQMITDIMKGLLKGAGNIDLVHNGQEALDLISQKYYKLIISDIDMPVMDGFALYREAVAQIPSLTGRFLFMTGDLSPERQKFFNENQVKSLAKPMGINVLRETASEIILSKKLQ